MSSLKSSSKVDLSYNSSLSDISGLSSLRTSLRVDLKGTNVTDLSSLENFEDGIIYLEDKTPEDMVQFNNPWNMSSPICQKILDRSVSIRFKSGSKKNERDLCKSDDEVVDFIIKNTTLSITTQSELEDQVLALNDKGFTDSDIPEANLWNFKSSFGIRLNNNNLTNVDFLSRYEETKYDRRNYGVNLSYNPNLSDISGLSSLKSSSKVDLRGTNVTDLSGLENFEKGSIYLQDKRPEDMVQFNNPWNMSSPICQKISNGEVSIRFKYKQGETTNAKDFCK